jgi:hypothetical protein
MLEMSLRAAQEKRKFCEAKRWELEFKGHKLSLRKLADAICSSLDKFKQIGDIAVNVDPLHAGLPWAGIRLLLQVWRSCTQSIYHGISLVPDI